MDLVHILNEPLESNLIHNTPIYIPLEPACTPTHVQSPVRQSELTATIRSCLPALSFVLPAWHYDTLSATWIAQLLNREPLTAGEQRKYYHTDTEGYSWGTVMIFGRDNYGRIEYRNELFMPNIAYERVGYDVQTFLRNRVPSNETVYNTLGVPSSLHGGGLSIIPDSVMGGRPRCSMSTMLQLALVSSPRKCLLGYEIIAMLKGHFRHYRQKSDNNWQLYVFRALDIYTYFNSLPSPPEVPYAEKVWYIDYFSCRPRAKAPGTYLWGNDPSKKRRHAREEDNIDGATTSASVVI